MKTIAAFLAMIGLLAGASQAQSASGQATAASVTTPATGSQTFARAALPAGGGMNTAGIDVAAVTNVLGAEGLKSITTGQADDALVSATATAEATDVNLLDGLIRAKVVFALATSSTDGTTASSESDGSTLLGLEVNGVSYNDGAPAPNTRITLPGVGYVMLNEQLAGGDGVRSSELTVNMVHVYLTDPVSGATTGEIVVGSARSGASR